MDEDTLDDGKSPGKTERVDVDMKPEAARLEAQLSRLTRRSLLLTTGALAAGAVAYRLLDHSKTIGTLRGPLRAAHDFNAQVSQNVFGQTALAPTFSQARANRNPAPYGPFGLRKDLDPASWRLQVSGLERPHRHPHFTENVAAWEYRYAPAFAETAAELDGEISTVSLMATANNKLPSPEELVDVSTALRESSPLHLRGPQPGLLLDAHYLRGNFPFVEQTTEFKCIEGWSEIITYGGIRFRDFLEAHPPQRNADGTWPKYAAMNTPDGSYYCGFEMEALLHPQTLLCFRMAGRELTPAHGAPLRLAMPLKYGYKQIKQIARIHYTNAKPQDYWANLGYDWHGGL